MNKNDIDEVFSRIVGEELEAKKRGWQSLLEMWRGYRDAGASYSEAIGLMAAFWRAMRDV